MIQHTQVVCAIPNCPQLLEQLCHELVHQRKEVPLLCTQGLSDLVQEAPRWYEIHTYLYQQCEKVPEDEYSLEPSLSLETDFVKQSIYFQSYGYHAWIQVGLPFQNRHRISVFGESLVFQRKGGGSLK